MCKKALRFNDEIVVDVHTGDLCGSGVVIARDSCSVKSSVTDHRHHPQVQQQPQQQQATSQLHQTNAAAVAVTRSSLQQSCYDEQRRLHSHHHHHHSQHHQQQQQRQPGADEDRSAAPSSADCIAIQLPQPLNQSLPQQHRVGDSAVLRHNHQLDHYGDSGSKLIKSEPSEAALAAAAAAAANAVVAAAAVSGARESAERKAGGVGRTAIGSASSSVKVPPDNTVDSQLHSAVNSTSASSSLNDVLSRHHHHQQQQTAEMHQTSVSGSFTVSSLVHPIAGSSVDGIASSVVDGGLGRGDINVDGVLNSLHRGACGEGVVVDADSTCFDPSSAAAAAAAAQWFAAAGGGHHQTSQYASSLRRTPELYMQRLHASITADRRHSVATAACIGLGDSDADGNAVPTFAYRAGSGSYAAAAAAAAWYGAAQSSDVISSPTAAGCGAYVGSGSLHDVFDVSAAATRMLSTRQSCAQLQTTSPFRAYYGGSGGGTAIHPGPASYAAYAEDCVSSAKY